MELGFAAVDDQREVPAERRTAQGAEDICEQNEEDRRRGELVVPVRVDQQHSEEVAG